MATINGTFNSLIAGTLSGTVATPGAQGPAGPAGSQGIPGVPGAPGVGVPAGGLTNQFLVKTSNADFATGWTTFSLAGYATEAWVQSQGYITSSALTPYLSKAGNLDGLTNLALARDNLQLGELSNPTFAGVNVSGSGTNDANLGPTFLTLNQSGHGQFTIQPSQGIVFPDASIQTTAFPAGSSLPSGGTVGQVLTKNSGTNYDASFATLIPGDRYLTSSTTSLTIDNANKTLTVGTGLSYTPTQNITISYNASNHMHGEVLTYDSGTGVLTVDINNHTGSGTYAAWVVNVGGVTPATSVAWGAITGTLGSQTDLATALNSKLEVSTAASTYQTLSGMSSYLTTSAAAASYYPLTGNPSGFLTSAPVTSVAGRTGAITLSNTDISGLGTMSTVNDSPSDSQTYGRNNGAWVVASGGGGVPEAPQDNFVYGRINATWIRIPGVAAFTQIATGVNSISSWSVTGGSVLIDGFGTVVASAPAGLTALNCTGNSGAVLGISAYTSLATLTASNWPDVGTLPGNLVSVGFYGCTFTSPPSFTVTSLVGCGFDNCSITTGPSFDYATVLSTVNLTNNTAMATTPTFVSCSALSSVTITNSPITSAPNLTAGVVSYFVITGCTSMTTAPSFSGSHTIYYADLSNCAITDCNSFGSFIYSNASYHGQTNGYLNMSGGTNEALDSSALPSWIADLQAMGWTVLYNSF